MGDREVQSDLAPKKLLSWMKFKAKSNVMLVANFTTKSTHFNHPVLQKVIYKLKCPCGLVYVGKTNRALKIRIAEHLSEMHWDFRQLQ